MSNKTRGSDALSAITAEVNAAMGSERPRHRPMPAPSSLMHMSAGFQETKAELERLKGERGKAIVVELDVCDDGPFHADPVDPARVANLVANLAENQQNSPALLRPKEGGRFEIIAGRHRKAALKELGKTTWDAVIRDYDDDTAERLTFFDNLFAPNISDYAKYLSFSQRQRNKGLTYEQLAKEAGVGKGTVGRLLAFGRLPAAALEAIATKPAAVGGKLAEELAALAEKHAERVSEAVQLVVDGKLSAGRAAAWVLNAKPAGKKVSESVIKMGRATFAKVARQEGRMVIRFTNPADAAAVEKEIEELLKRRAAAAKST